MRFTLPRRTLLITFTLLLASVLVGTQAFGSDDRLTVEITTSIPSLGVVHYSSSEVPVSFSSSMFQVPEQETVPGPRISPALQARLSASQAEHVETLMITLSQEVRIPRFPRPVLDEPPTSARNEERRAQAHRLIEQVRAERRPFFEAKQAAFAPFGVDVVETFWIAPAMKVRAPLSRITELLEDSDVLYVELDQTSVPPPGNDIVDARSYMRSDPVAGIATGGYVGLLDTGVRSTHTLLSGPSPLRYVRDCVNGTSSNCTVGSGLNPDDDCWNHGTASASIITANSNLGDASRGVDWITLDSFKVYPSSCGGLNTSAVLRGFEAALAVLDEVIVAEMQSPTSDAGSIALAADGAYDAGAIVIAANGNLGAVTTVAAPANAHKALGIGAFDVQTLAQYSNQALGPAPDGRIKPDIQTPNNTRAASTSSSTALQVFGGTSGSTPYAAGAAIAVRNWLAKQSAGSWLPGIGYSWMILFGQTYYPFDNTSGAGHWRFREDALIWSAYLSSLSAGGQSDIPLSTYPHADSDFPYNFVGAIWWPEEQSHSHVNIDLFLVDPSGVVRASSTSVPGVFEHARVAGPLASGDWKIRVKNNGSRSQEVFISAYRTRNP